MHSLFQQLPPQLSSWGEPGCEWKQVWVLVTGLVSVQLHHESHVSKEHFQSLILPSENVIAMLSAMKNTAFLNSWMITEDFTLLAASYMFLQLKSN